MKNRRDFLIAAATAASSLVLPANVDACNQRRRDFSPLSFGRIATQARVRSRAFIEHFDLYVHTNGDNKDDVLWWDAYIMWRGGYIARAIALGYNQTWDNPSTSFFSFGTDYLVFPYEDRRELSLLIQQNRKLGEKNYGWEGSVSMTVGLYGGGHHPVVSNTGRFKLGENDNPLQREFPFNL